MLPLSDAEVFRKELRELITWQVEMGGHGGPSALLSVKIVIGTVTNKRVRSDTLLLLKALSVRLILGKKGNN